MARIRLVLTDIDGTVVPYGAERISPRMEAAFRSALSAGIRIGPASGRGYAHIAPSFGAHEELFATCLATNGMQVFLDGELVCERRLASGAVRELAGLVSDIEGAGVVCFEDGVPLLVCGSRRDLTEHFPLYARQARDADDVPDHDIEKANVFVAGDMERTREVFESLRQRVRGVELKLPMAGFLNVVPPGWSKASAIDVLADAMGITLDEVAVFGDGGNDVEMLAHVGASAAVAGASAEAKAAAHHLIGRVEDDAVADAILGIVDGTWPA